jgi:hypothetical protein
MSARIGGGGEEHTFYWGLQWWLHVKELRYFVEVSVQVILVEHKDGLWDATLECVVSSRELETIPGCAPRPGSTSCPFSASVHPRDMQGQHSLRFLSLYG